MATLHDAVDSTKKFLLFGVIGIVILTIGYFLVQGGFALKEAFFPEEIPPPTEDFGDLPDIVFPANATVKPLTYQIDTVTGKFPDDYPSRMLVYEILEHEPTLQDIKVAKDKVSKIGFVTREQEISPTTFQWTDLKIFSRTMTMDIVTGNFYFSTDFMTNPAFLESTTIVDETRALIDGKKFLTNLSSFPSDIDEKLTKAQHFTVENGKQILSETATDTEIIRIDYFQKPIPDELDEEIAYPIYYPKPDKSPINILVGKGAPDTVVEAHYTHHPISESAGEYGIKSPGKAFEELKKGEGYIASYFGTESEMKIKNVSLGYYLGEGKQSYAQPIWIFYDELTGFYAYVPAVDDYWNNPPAPEETDSGK